MQLDRENLREKKSINQLIDLCIKLNSDNEELRTKIANLKKEKASQDVRNANKNLREENRKLKAKIDKFKEIIG